MHFPPVSNSPYFRKILRLREILNILPFPDKISDFHPPKFLITFFFSHRPQMLNFPPILPVLVHFPSDSRKLLFPPYFKKFPSMFSENSSAFYMLSV